MTQEYVLYEVGGWLIVALLTFIVVLLCLKVVLTFKPVFKLLDYLAMPGTIVHELGHYLACKIYGIRVAEVKWFHWGYMLNRERAFYDTDGTMGYVQRAEPAPNLFVQFQISAAPLVSCGLFWLLGIGGVHLIVAENLPFAEKLTPLQEGIAIVILLWIGLASASSMLPSSGDMQNVLNYSSRNPLGIPIRIIAWIILAINNMLNRYVDGVHAWGMITTLVTLAALLQFSIPGGQAYLEPFGAIANAIRDFAEASKEIG